MEKKQTAVEYAIDRLHKMGIIEHIDDPLVEQIRNESLAMEREQIISADFAGVKRTALVVNKYHKLDVTLAVISKIESGEDTHDDGIEYYNKTYGK